MGSRLTSEERRRVFLTQERARRDMLARLSGPAAVDGDGDRRRLPRFLRAALKVALFTGGLAFYALVELHAPVSLVEALLPRW